MKSFMHVCRIVDLSNDISVPHIGKFWRLNTVYSGLFLRGKIFANFTKPVQFMKILPSNCLFSVGSLRSL